MPQVSHIAMLSVLIHYPKSIPKWDMYLLSYLQTCYLPPRVYLFLMLRAYQRFILQGSNFKLFMFNICFNIYCIYLTYMLYYGLLYLLRTMVLKHLDLLLT